MASHFEPPLPAAVVCRRYWRCLRREGQRRAKARVRLISRMSRDGALQPVLVQQAEHSDGAA
jgi:hypothetical protein